MYSMNYFYSMIFGSSIWSSICWWNSLKLLHVLYSDFHARVKHKNKLHLTVLLLRFVFCLRGVKYTFTIRGFLLDLIIPLHRGNFKFFLAAWKVTYHTTDHFSTIRCIILNALTPEADLLLLQHLRWSFLWQ